MTIPRAFLAVFVLAIMSTFADALTEETLEVKVFDRDLQLSEDEMLELLKKVDLESHGYKKQVTTKLVSEPGSDKPIYKKSFLYFKVVDCSRLREIDQELQNLMPGIFRTNLVTKINTEIRTKNLTNMKRCKVGLEVHFKKDCNDKKKHARRQRDTPTSGRCNGCIFCWAAKLSA